MVGFSAYRIVKKSFLIQTNAVITDIVKVRKGVGDYYYSFKVSFLAKEKEYNVEIIDDRYYIIYTPRDVGETLSIKYNPDNPEEIYLTEDANTTLIIDIFLCAYGGVLIIVGATVCVVMSRKKSSSFNREKRRGHWDDLRY